MTESELGSGQIDKDGHHVFALRVYYEDTDSGGVVYYANYLRYAERARTEFLRCLGIDQRPLLAEQEMALAVRRCTVDFHRPACLDDALGVATAVASLGPAHIDLNQIIRRNSDTLVDIEVTIVCVRQGRAVRIPPVIHSAFATISLNLPSSRRNGVVRSAAARGAGAG
jgi:acyl-CoA thioester hydrolase